MADKVKIIHIGHTLVGLYRFKVDALIAQKFPDGFLFILCRPLANKVIQRSVCATDIFLCVVDDAFLFQQFAACIVYGDGLVNHFHAAAVFIHNRLRIFRANRRVRGVRAGLRRRLWGIFVGVVVIVHFDRAIPFRVSKQAADIAEVHDNEMRFSLFLS